MPASGPRQGREPAASEGSGTGRTKTLFYETNKDEYCEVVRKQLTPLVAAWLTGPAVFGAEKPVPQLFGPTLASNKDTYTARRCCPSGPTDSRRAEAKEAGSGNVIY
ncbi:hypothetical protein EYF80_007170 [Liparis tanakae]|uniref:Uncharacterized protein n=1 Tax=Liparis tanakae TaxID=230148 RepID=A0A4Z2IZE3_9TELE|nr:hypothetical protein EYF80_007170 [Liparis tanakae]